MEQVGQKVPQVTTKKGGTSTMTSSKGKQPAQSSKSTATNVTTEKVHGVEFLTKKRWYAIIKNEVNYCVCL